MNVTRKQQRVIQRALDEWQAAGALSHAENQRLAATLRVSAFDWQRLSRYAFWTALACLLIALGSVLADSELIAWLVSLFSDSALARIALPAAVALVCYLWGFRRQRRAAYWHYSTEAILFGGVLLALCFMLQKWLLQRRLFTVSKAMGLTYLFIALWILSIFGYRDLDAWYSISPLQQLPWALLFGVAAGICIYISLKTDDGMLRGFGLTFLAINLYTRFFEFFWDGMHKVVFFLILAVSLAVIGRYAERIWHAGERRARED